MKPKRTTNDIEAHLVACYEWKPAAQPPEPHPDDLVCVSTPQDQELPRTVATWDGQVFRDVHGAEIKGVTFWCFLPETPEDALAARKAEAAAPEAAAATGQANLL